MTQTSVADLQGIRYSIIVPDYNEEVGLPIVVRQLQEALDESYEIIVVDDGSSDRTLEIAKSLGCRVIAHPSNRGKGAAMRTGIRHELDIRVRWEGTGVSEKGYDSATGHGIVAVDPTYSPPTEVETLRGDATKARQKLAWMPKISFPDLVREMVPEDHPGAERDALCSREAFRVLGRYE